jgi:hypothetical protein
VTLGAFGVFLAVLAGVAVDVLLLPLDVLAIGRISPYFTDIIIIIQEPYNSFLNHFSSGRQYQDSDKHESKS